MCIIIVLSILVTCSCAIDVAIEGPDTEALPQIRRAYCQSFCIGQQNLQESSCLLDTCNCTGKLNETDTLEFNKLLLESPKLRCRAENFLNFHWEVVDDFSYFAEIIGERRFYAFATNCSSYSLQGLKENGEFIFKLWAVSYKQKEIRQSDYVKAITRKKNETPLSVPKISLNKLILKGDEYEAIITWTPASDLSCFYDFMWFGSDTTMGDYKQLVVKDPDDLYQIQLNELEFDRNYSVSVMAKNSDWSRESPKTWLYITTPSCLESYLSLDKCPPEMPKDLQVDEYVVNVDSDDDGPFCDIRLNWSTPIFYPDYYVAYFINLIPANMNYSRRTLNISGLSTDAVFKEVKLGIFYQVGLTAHSRAGSSKTAMQNRQVTGSGAAITSSYRSWSTSEWLVRIVGPLSGVLLLIVLLVFYNHYRAKRERFEQRCKYFKELEQKLSDSYDTIHVDMKIDDFVDEWEVEPDRLFLQTVLGEGAFGIVRRGWLKCNEGKKMEVAIKMLKDSPSQEEVRQFQHEIELMKSVGSHPNIVSIIGCVTHGRPEGPLLVVEHCARGDLQSYLRQAWEYLTNQNIDLAQINSESFESGKHVANRLYEIESNFASEYRIEAKDLLSFARQVVIGMEYLSGMRVVHRDLAARNVLVCSDRTVKVSDFGLSRDIYRDNVYCKSGGGKLPVRWMALESLTHQRYTTQSDIWSFGILLWEIITLGGSPYPGVASQDLLCLLKSGYRMEKPINCSNEVYNVMLHCWKASPKDRPTFGELRHVFDVLLEHVTDYVHLDFDESSNEYENHKNCQKKTLSSERYIKPIGLGLIVFVINLFYLFYKCCTSVRYYWKHFRYCLSTRVPDYDEVSILVISM